MTTEDEKLVEALAAYAHKAWSGRMEYLFEQCIDIEYPTAAKIVPVWAVLRWRCQMKTPYADLPEEEKVPDRQEALDILRIIRKISCSTE